MEAPGKANFPIYFLVDWRGGYEEMVSCWDGVECCNFLFLQDGEADMQLCCAVMLCTSGMGLLIKK